MELKKSIALAIFFKFIFLSINLATGILIARNLTLWERGNGGILFSLVAIFSVWLSTDQNESTLRNRLHRHNIEINVPEQLTIITLLVIVSFNLNLQVHLSWLYLMILFSFYNSRLLNRIFDARGIALDRLLQLLHLIVILLLIISLSILKLLNLSNWMVISLLTELIFSTVLFRISKESTPLIQISFTLDTFRKRLDYNNLFYVTDMLGDRLVILILAFVLSTSDIGILTIAMSLVLVIGTPFTASYPYPLKHAREIKTRLHKIEWKEIACFLIGGISYALIGILGIIEFAPIVFGIKYAHISELAVAIVFSGFFLSLAKLLSTINRGLSRDFLGNKLNFLGLILSATFVVSLREKINALEILFICMGISNLCICLYLIYRIRNKVVI